MTIIPEDVSLPSTRPSSEILRQSSEYQDDGLTYGDDELILEKIEVTKKRGISSLLALSMCFGALQTVFAILASYGTLHLTSIGLSKSIIALSWLAGPIAGTVVQPYCGMRSDSCEIRWGRRRPFVVGGSLGIIVTFISFAWAPDLMSQEVPNTGHNQLLGKAVAVLSIVLLQVAIQPVQVGLRALIIDICPPQQQNQASAWVARMIGVGNILGQLAGSTNIPKYFPFLAKTQLKDLCIFSSSFLFLAVTVLCISIEEKDPSNSRLSRRDSLDKAVGLVEVLVVIKKLPKEIVNGWSIQFFSWMGWFPFITYITTFFDYINSHTNSIQLSTSKSRTQLARDESLRIGSKAMLLYACISLVCSITLPFLLSASKYITLPKLWMTAHLLFATAMLSTLVVSGAFGVMSLIAILGVSWACTIWIPFLLISERTSKTVVQASWNVPRPGLVMSLNNVSIAAPQVVSALLCSVVLWVVGEGEWDTLGLSHRGVMWYRGCLVDQEPEG